MCELTTFSIERVTAGVFVLIQFYPFLRSINRFNKLEHNNAPGTSIFFHLELITHKQLSTRHILFIVCSIIVLFFLFLTNGSVKDGKLISAYTLDIRMGRGLSVYFFSFR